MRNMTPVRLARRSAWEEEPTSTVDWDEPEPPTTGPRQDEREPSTTGPGQDEPEP